MQEQGENCLRIFCLYGILTENGGLCMEKDAFAYPELHYFKSGNTYSGSYKGLNYILTPDDETLHIAVWYGMYCSAVSEMKALHDLPLTAEGLAESRQYLWEQYVEMVKTAAEN